METKSTRIECADVYATPDASCGDSVGKRDKIRLDVCCWHDLTLEDTAAAMRSPDYKERFRAEYAQTKIRYEKLKAFNNRIDAAFRTSGVCPRDVADKRVEMPAHDCPADLLREQQSVMGQYLHVLEVRAVIEGIDLCDC